MILRRLLLYIGLFWTIPALAQFTCPQNIDFEDGNTGYWKFYTGTCCPIATPTLTAALPNRHVITTGTGTDYYGGFPIVAPGGGSHSLKLGNNSTGAQAERATYFVHVPAGVNNYSLIYRYAVVFENPNHTASQQPRFEVKAYDSTTGATIPCGQFTYVSSASLPGFSLSPNGYQVWYKSWATASIDLSGQAGKVIAVDFASGDCSLGGHFGYGYIDLNCSLFQIVSVNCNGSPTTTLSAPPGFQTYEWYNSSYTQVATGQTATIATPSTTSQYYVILTPYVGYGCPDTLTTTVSVSSLNVNATNDTFICNSGSIQLDANATGTASTYNYSWTPATGLSCTSCASPIATPTSNTTYNVTVTDGNGCMQTDTVQLSVSPIATATASSLMCNGATTATATITAIQGQTPYTYSWNTTPGQTTSTATGLGAGNYTAIVTDANGCTDTATVSITQPAAINTTIVATNVICSGVNNGSATVSATGGASPYTYSWNTSPVQTTASVNNLASGIYVVTVTDANGCTKTDTAIVSQPSTGLVVSASATNVSCNAGSNGAASVTVAGGTTPYSYSWNTTVTQTSSSVNGLSAGNYTVTVTDANGCSANGSVTINEPPALTSSLATTSINCFGDNTGNASILVSGGTGTYSYSWNTTPAQTTNALNNVASGNYTVTITDANGCTLIDTAIITQPSSALTVNISATTDVNCSGGTDGAATVTATGGTAPYSYSWNTSPIQTTATATGLAAGAYTATITDAHGCTTIATASISQPAPLSVTTTTTNVSCFGGANGTATATANGGTASYTYSWTSGANTATANNLNAGNYTVTVTDAHGCTASTSVTITEPAALTGSFTQTNISCVGGNGTATITPSGGTAPYTYLWNTTPAQTTASISNLNGGTYQVTVTDNNGCSYSGSVTIMQPANAVTGAITTTDVSCYNGTNGTATVTATGGVPPYTYSWNTTPVQTGTTINNLTSGTYTATITDANGCFTTATAIINQPPALTSIITTTDVDCHGGTDGTATVTATGGTAPYSYSWNTSPAQTTATATGLTAGTYTATVTDSHGCTSTATASVSQPTALSLATTSTNVSCFGGNNGTATVSATGGTAPYTYNWTSGATAATASNLSAGNYTVTVTDAHGCSATSSVTIAEPASLTGTFTQTNISCAGGKGTATVTPSGGTAPYTYLWNTTPAQTTASISNLNGGTYQVTVTDNRGCSYSGSVTITQPANAVTGAITTTDVSCYNGTNGTATVTATGGVPPYTYSWNTTPVQTGTTINNLTSGTYTATITDANGCFTTATAIINQPPALTSIITTTDVNCHGGTDGTATVTTTGGTGPYSYSWNTSPIQTTATATGLTAGTYTATITDAHGCTSTATTSVSQPTALSVATTSTNVSCFGGNNGTATVSATGGTTPYTYNWTSGATAATANNLSAGNYTVTVTDAHGCSATSSVTIAEPVPLAASFTQTNISCTGGNGTATVTPSGGTAPYTYLWNTTPAQTTASISNLNGGTYQVTVTDNNGCSYSGSVTITQPANAVTGAITTTDVSCYNGTNGTATVTAAGGVPPYTYSWNTTPVQTGTTSNNLTSGTYTATITDANGCFTTATAIINQPPALTSIITTTDVNCHGGTDGTATVTTTGGTGPYSYSWNTTPVQTTATAIGLSAGTYTAIITDAHGCTSTTTATVNEPATPLNATATSSAVNCSGGNNATATATPSGGTAPYTYVWNTTPAQTAATATSLAAGTYTATVTDAHGCTTTASVTISQPLAPVTASITTTTPATCDGGTNGNATVLASGGVPPYAYSWNTSPIQNATTATSLTAGSYTVVVTDANGCSDTATATITQPAALVTSFSNTSVSCFGNSNGASSVTVTGGIAPYAYSWNTTPVQTSPSVANLSAGTYTVHVTDNNGCSTTGSITITQPAQLTASIPSSSNITCAGMNNGSASALATGGTAPYSYSWNTAQTTASLNNLSSGTYTVNITDNNGCTASDSITLTEPPPLATTTGNIMPVNCNGSATGSASITVNGGTTPYNYSWNTAPPQSTANATNLAAGNYIVTVTDSNGCTQTDSVSVTEPNAITLSTAATKTCAGSSSASAYVMVNGGIAPYSLSWSTVPAQTTDTINNLSSGSYTVSVTDANGCIQSAVATVSSYPSPVIEAGPDQKVCAGSDLQLQVSGANSYSWSPATWLSCTNCESPVTYPNGDITYTVVGTDANSCMDTAVVHITVIDHVPVSIDGNKEMCEGDTVRLTATGGTAYNWTPPYGLTNTHTSNPLASPSATTQYQVVITENECFSDTLTQTVTVHPLPTIKLGPDETVMAGTEITIPSEITNASSITWAPPTGLSCTDCNNPIATLDKTITYKATAYNDVGCKATDEVTYTVTCDNSVLFMPNTFTPNADGLNDTYYPIGRGISTIKRFAIYNRWGQKLYEVLNIPASEGKFGWDGTFQGVQLKPDVFVYMVEAICTTGDPVTLKGDVSLIR